MLSALDPTVYKWPTQPCTGGGHYDYIVIGMDHPWFKSSRATSDGCMRPSPGHRCHTIGPLWQHNPYQGGFESSNRPYGREFIYEVYIIMYKILISMIFALK
jgi:hypothetical protein